MAMLKDVLAQRKEEGMAREVATSATGTAEVL
jgi:hypothetical protein